MADKEVIGIRTHLRRPGAILRSAGSALGRSFAVVVAASSKGDSYRLKDRDLGRVPSDDGA
jgi:hypothetical protein